MCACSWQRSHAPSRSNGAITAADATGRLGLHATARYIRSPDRGRPPLTRRSAARGRGVGRARPLPGRLRGSSSELPPSPSKGGGALGRRAGAAGHRRRRTAGGSSTPSRSRATATTRPSRTRAPGWEAICDVLFSPLYSYDTDNSPRPNAAAAMPKVSADGMVYTHPASQGRDVPQRPAGGRGRLQVLVGAGARSEDRRAGRRATSTRSRAPRSSTDARRRS